MKKKVVILCGYFPFESGGAEYQSYILAQYLQKKYDVSYISLQPEYSPQATIHNGFTIYGIPKHRFLRRFGKTNFIDSFRVYSLLKKIKPSCIYQSVGSADTGVAAFYSLKHPECNFIWHIASEMDVNKFKFEFKHNVIFNFIDSLIFYYGVRHAKYIFAQTDFQKQKLHENFNRDANFVIKNFLPVPEKVKFPVKPARIVWLANLKYIKQPQIFIDLAKELKDLDAKFIMIGRNNFFKNPDFFSEADNLEFLGELPQEKVNEILSEATMLVNTSISEGFSNAFIQAWLRGVPVISLNTDPDDLIKKYKMGFCSKTFSQLAIDVRRLVEDIVLRKEMSGNARTYAVKHHSLDNIQQIEKFFE